MDVRQVARELACAACWKAVCAVAVRGFAYSRSLLMLGTGKHIWAERYDRPLEDVFVVQDEIARAVVGQTSCGRRGRTTAVHVAEADGKSQCRFDRYFRSRPLVLLPSNTNISATACARRAGMVEAAQPRPAKPHLATVVCCAGRLRDIWMVPDHQRGLRPRPNPCEIPTSSQSDPHVHPGRRYRKRNDR